jgi:hypothetical protein
VRAAIELETILRELCCARLLDRIGSEKLGHMIEQVAARAIDPYSAAEQLLS